MLSFIFAWIDDLLGLRPRWLKVVNEKLPFIVRAKGRPSILVLHHTAGAHRIYKEGGRREYFRTAINGNHAYWQITRDGTLIAAKNNCSAFDRGVHVSGRRARMILDNKELNGKQINRNSIGIELCNLGHLTRDRNGNYLTHFRKKVEKGKVKELEGEPCIPYSKAQIETLKKTVKWFRKRHKVKVVTHRDIQDNKQDPFLYLYDIVGVDNAHE